MPLGLVLAQAPEGVVSVTLCDCSATDGSVGQLGHERLVGLDAVDQPPQRDVDPARHLLPFEVADVVRGLGGDVVSQLEDLVGADVGAEAADESTRVLEGGLFVVLDVAEHERRHHLGIEEG